MDPDINRAMCLPLDCEPAETDGLRSRQLHFGSRLCLTCHISHNDSSGSIVNYEQVFPSGPAKPRAGHHQGPYRDIRHLFLPKSPILRFLWILLAHSVSTDREVAPPGSAPTCLGLATDALYHVAALQAIQ